MHTSRKHANGKQQRCHALLLDLPGVLHDEEKVTKQRGLLTGSNVARQPITTI